MHAGSSGARIDVMESVSDCADADIGSSSFQEVRTKGLIRAEMNLTDLKARNRPFLGVVHCLPPACRLTSIPNTRYLVQALVVCHLHVV
jgi:hypothetical protein